MQLIYRVCTAQRLIYIVLCIVMSLILAVFVYYKTKGSYWAVGFNDGSIQTNMEVIERIKSAVGKINACKNHEDSFERVEILRVKTNFLYLIKSKDGYIEFCQL